MSVLLPLLVEDGIVLFPFWCRYSLIIESISVCVVTLKTSSSPSVAVPAPTAAADDGHSETDRSSVAMVDALDLAESSLFLLPPPPSSSSPLQPLLLASSDDASLPPPPSSPSGESGGGRSHEDGGCAEAKSENWNGRRQGYSPSPPFGE